MRESSGSGGCWWLRPLIRDRRGVTAVTFAMVATVVLGIAGLATEVGGWYAGRQRGQNAADAAAEAGAIAVALGGGNSGAIASAQNVAAQNGFASNVTVNNPPASGPNIGNAGAVEVILVQKEALLLARLFLTSNPVMTTRAVAAVQSGGQACAVALAGGSGLSMGGHSTTTASNCSLASNASGGNAIVISGSATVSAYTLSSAAGCSGCAGSNVSLTRPASAYQLPASNPFAAADNVTLPGSPTYIPAGSLPQPYTSGNPVEYNGNFSLQSQQTLTLVPGTYFFNGSISLEGGSTLQCPTCTGTGSAGVTIVMTDSASTLSIDGHAAVTLTAPATNSYAAGFNGLLFYQKNGGTPGGVSIDGGASSTLTGGLYFPTETVSFDGNESINPSACTEIVAETLTIAGNAATTLNSSGCSQSGTATAQMQVVRLVE